MMVMLMVMEIECDESAVSVIGGAAGIGRDAPISVLSGPPGEFPLIGDTPLRSSGEITVRPHQVEQQPSSPLPFGSSLSSLITCFIPFSKHTFFCFHSPRIFFLHYIHH